MIKPANPQFTPQYVTRKQAAQMLACSDQLISKLIKNGRLPACYVGRAVRIRLSDLEAMLTPVVVKGRVQ